MDAKLTSVLAVAFAFLVVVGGCEQLQHKQVDVAVTSRPLEGVSDAYEAAALRKLDDRTPDDWDDLHNVYHLSETIVSGSEPHGEAALERLAQMGVKTIISVDGKAPDHEVAAQFGLRYVHIPIQYKGISEDELLRLAKTFRELEAPFYVHCFHGKHRGPAAAAIGRLVLDGAPREQALAEMRQWCGTGKKYPGLYEVVAKGMIPSAGATGDYAFNFAPALPLGGFRHAMIEMSRVFENVEHLAKRNFEVDPSHPDLDAVNEAAKLSQVYRQSTAMPELKVRPPDFMSWLELGDDEAQRLVESLRRVREGDSAALEDAQDAFRQVDKSCTSCHLKYRNL